MTGMGFYWAEHLHPEPPLRSDPRSGGYPPADPVSRPQRPSSPQSGAIPPTPNQEEPMQAISDPTFFAVDAPEEPLPPRLAALRDGATEPVSGKRRAERVDALEARARLITNVLDDIERYRRHAVAAPVTNHDVVVMLDVVIRREVRRLTAERTRTIDEAAVLGGSQ